MSSRASLFCSRLIEAGWLAVIILAPLYFNGYSGQSLEADKVALIRSIVAVMASAWFVRWLDERGNSPRPGTRGWWAVPPVLLLGVFLLSTLTSVVPLVSFQGAFPLAQGTHLLLSCTVLMVLLVLELRTRAQYDRLMFTILLTAVALSVYALIQYFHWDPLIWGASLDQPVNGDASVLNRPSGQMGNPIFLSAYLIMAGLLGAGKFGEAAHAAIGAARAHAPWMAHIARTGLYGAALTLELAALLTSQSRGPLLGCAAGLALAVLLVAAWQNRRRAILVFCGLAAFGGILLGAFNVPNMPWEPLRTVPAFDRWSHLLRSEGYAAEGRNWIWEGEWRMFTGGEPLHSAEGQPDALHLVRPLIGFGPDSLQYIYDQFAPPLPIYQESLTDRSHNEIWETMISAGLLGVAAYELVWASLFWWGLRALGLAPSRREAAQFACTWIGGGVLLALAAIALSAPSYAALGLGAGNALGLGLYVILRVWSSREVRAPRIASEQVLWVISLLAALLAHWVESQFGIEISGTRTLFWLMAGLTIVLTVRGLDPETATVEALPAPQPRRRARAVVPPPAMVSAAVSNPAGPGTLAGYALLTSLVLTVLSFEFITYSRNVTDPWSVVVQSLTVYRGSSGITFAIPGMLAAVWLTGVLLAQAEAAASGRYASRAKAWRGLGAMALGALLLPVLFGTGLAYLLARFVAIPLGEPQIAVLLSIGDQSVGVVHYALAAWMVLLAALALALSWDTRGEVWWKGPRWGLALAVPALAAATLLVNVANLNPMRAGVYASLGHVMEGESNPEIAMLLYQRAVRLSPTTESYVRALGRAYSTQAQNAPGGTIARLNDATTAEMILGLDDAQIMSLTRGDLLYAAQALLARARALAPFDYQPYLHLARFYRPDPDSDSPAKNGLLDLSDKFYAQALRLAPNRPSLWNEWAEFALTFRKDSETALARADESLRWSKQAPGTYVVQGRAYQAQGELDRAVSSFERAISTDPREAEPYSALAFALYKGGRLAEAADAYIRYIWRAYDAPNVWEAHKNLGLIEAERGRFAQAVKEGQIAEGMAPSVAQGDLAKLVAAWMTQAQ